MHAGGDEHDREDERDRQQDPDHATGEVDPEVAEAVGLRTEEPADQRHGDGDADRGRQEVLDREARHLDGVAHHLLGHVGLPVRVGHERDGVVEGHRGRDLPVDAPSEAHGQQRLEPLDEVEQQHAEEGEREQRRRVGRPALSRVGVHAHDPVDRPLDPQVLLAGERPRHVVAEGDVHDREQHDEECGLQEAPTVSFIRSAPDEAGRR